ncbi:ATP-binding protein [bacterium]|nr:ATP-binding protein [bacterium]
MKNRKKTISLTIPSTLDQLEKVEKLSSSISKKMELSSDQTDNLAIAVTEAVGNAIVHGNKMQKEKTVDIVFKLSTDELECSVSDRGKGFNEKSLSDPLDPENIMKESGRGIFILEALMDSVSYSFSSEGTTVTFVLKKKFE